MYPNAVTHSTGDRIDVNKRRALIIKKLHTNKQRELASQASKKGKKGQSIKTANKAPAKDKVQIKLPPRIKIQKHTKQETNGRLEEKQEEHQTKRSIKELGTQGTSHQQMQKQTEAMNGQTTEGRQRPYVQTKNNKTRHRLGRAAGENNEG